MSRLDRHVALVQNKLAMQRFVDALCLLLPIVAAVCLAVRLVERQTTLVLHRELWWAAGGAVAVVIALVVSVVRRPQALDAAVAIDERLGLKEKFSTALAVRSVNDPFAMAAVRDAEYTADNVSLHRQFPLAPPKAGNLWVWLVLVAAAVCAFLIPADAFGHKAAIAEKARLAEKQAVARKSLDTTIQKVEMIAQKFPNAEGIAAAKKELEKLKTAQINDIGRTSRSAVEILNNLDKTIKNDIAKSEQVAKDATNRKLLSGLEAPDDKGPVAEATKAMKEGDLKTAMKNLNDVAKNFDKMNDEEKKKAAQQMANLAQQLQKQANNPQQQQAAAQQLAQQLGVNQQQAQQMAQQMQQAAAGNKQAQQQLAQQAQQAMQQMNNGNGPTPQQQQALQQMMQGLQAQANGQMTAQQMGNAAQQMAQAMQQAQQAGNQPGGQNNNANQGQAGNNQQQMANANQQIQQQLQDMEAIANDAQQQQAAQNDAQQAAKDAAGQCNNPGAGQGNNQAGNGQGKVGGGKSGQWAAGDPNNKPGKGQGGPGQAAGGGTGKDEAPFDVKAEHAPVQNNEDGKFIASQFVKAGALKGESLAQLQQVTASADHQETDDVDADHVSGEAKKAVKGYFGQFQGK